MYCTHCGASNKERATECGQCGQPLTAAPIAETIPNYLVQAILLAVFSPCCCLFLGTPFGIVAAVYASQVNSKIAIQDLEGARHNSQLARNWCWAAFGCDLFGIIIIVLSYLFGFLDPLKDHLH